jgi:uncharacterized protein
LVLIAQGFAVKRRVAVVGSGISGLSAAHALADSARVTLLEAGPYFGGHTHTVDITLEGVTHGVDTGFLVFNERTYPRLIALLRELGVAIALSEMSFSVQAQSLDLEWSGSDLNTVFAQRRNLWRPRFWGMLREIVRFNRLCNAMALQTPGEASAQTIQYFLAQHRFSRMFMEGYFLPMVACIWSCPVAKMLNFPMATMLRFCHNHGLLQIMNRPRWFTVPGGARQYVEKIVARLDDARLNTPVRQVIRDAQGVGIVLDSGTERFDDVVLACHSDQALALLREPSAQEKTVLGAIQYHRNRAVLHTDVSLLPKRRLAWAAWNYVRAEQPGQEQAAVCLHYLINRLQPLPFKTPVIVSLNPITEPDARTVHGVFDYAHPVFDQAAIAAQQQLGGLQGQRGTWFCGAWTRYGFHEDGLLSGLAAAQGVQAQWRLGAAG